MDEIFWAISSIIEPFVTVLRVRIFGKDCSLPGEYNLLRQVGGYYDRIVIFLDVKGDI